MPTLVHCGENLLHCHSDPPLPKQTLTWPAGLRQKADQCETSEELCRRDFQSGPGLPSHTVSISESAWEVLNPTVEAREAPGVAFAPLANREGDRS